MFIKYIRAAVAAAFTLLIFSTGYSAEPYAYVVNSLGETLSRINLNSGIVQNNIITLGSDINSAPNQIIVRDTLAYVVNSGTDEIQIINLNNNQTIDYISTGPNSNPYWMAFYDSRFAYVTLLLENKIARVDIINKTVTKFNTGVSPAGVIVHDHRLFVACSGFDYETFEYDPAFVRVYDIGSDTLLAEIPVGINCQYLAADRWGRIHAEATGDYSTIWGRVYIIDAASYEIVDYLATGGSPGQITIAPDNVAYLAAGGWSKEGFVYSYNSLNGEIYHDDADPLAVDKNCLAVTAYQDSTLFAGSFNDFINNLDSAGNNQGHYLVGDGPVHLDFNYLPGDIDGDFVVNILDIIYYIDYKFKGGPDIRYPRWRANVNGDYQYNILDVILLINFKYKNGPAPRIGPAWLEPFPVK